MGTVICGSAYSYSHRFSGEYIDYVLQAITVEHGDWI